MKHKVICVLGAYRSGTSMITNILNGLGAYLGEETDLRPGLDGMNPDGFFQHRAVEKINSSMLGKSKTHGTIFSGLKKGWEKTVDVEEKEIDLFIKKFSCYDVWGMKDNNTNFFIDVWDKHFRANGLDIYYVLIVRNPREAIASMVKAWDISVEQARWLWVAHNYHALKGVNGKKYKILIHSNVLHVPIKSIQELKAFLHLNTDIKKAVAIVNPSLRHNKQGVSECSDILNDIYESIVALSEGKDRLENILNEIETCYNNILVKLGGVDETKTLAISFCNENSLMLKKGVAVWDLSQRGKFKINQCLAGNGAVNDLYMKFDFSYRPDYYVQEYDLLCRINNLTKPVRLRKTYSLMDDCSLVRLKSPSMSITKVEIEGEFKLARYSIFVRVIRKIASRLLPSKIKKYIRIVLLKSKELLCYRLSKN